MKRFWVSVEYSFAGSLIQSGLVDGDGFHGADGEKLKKAWTLFQSGLAQDLREVGDQGAYDSGNEGDQSRNALIGAALALLLGFILGALLI